jgi:hypothetical protein
VGDEASLVVHALEAGVGEPGVDEREDAVEVLANGSGEADEGSEARAVSPRDPGFSRSARIVGARVGEDVEEGLLQEIGPVERIVGPSDDVELDLLAGP